MAEEVLAAVVVGVAALTSGLLAGVGVFGTMVMTVASGLSANDDEDASSADSSTVLAMPLLWVGVACGSGVDVEGRGIATTTTGRGPL